MPTYALGSNERPLTIWEWNARDEAPRVVESSGPGSDKPIEAKLQGEHREKEGERSVLLKGSTAAKPAGLMIAASGCSKRGSYLTSSTVSPLR
jgi:hypothetical protein